MRLTQRQYRDAQVALNYAEADSCFGEDETIDDVGKSLIRGVKVWRKLLDAHAPGQKKPRRLTKRQRDKVFGMLDYAQSEAGLLFDGPPDQREQAREVYDAIEIVHRLVKQQAGGCDT